MALTSDQRRVLNQILAVGRRRGATPKEIKAAVETGLVESNLRNLPGGDADSAGWRQERASLYKDPTNLGASINRFFNETAAVRGKYGRAGDLAAAVQRPAAQYRGRYQQHAGEAAALIGGRAPGGRPAPLTGGGTTTRITTRTPGVDNRAARYQLVSNFLNSSSFDPVSFATQFKTLADVPASSRTRTTHSGGGGGPQSSPHAVQASGVHGALPFEGKPVAAWIAPVLKFARQQGWKGTVNSGVRSLAEQTRIYNSGRRPAARPGTSNHEFTAFPGGAVDVSDAAQLSAILKRSKYANLLVWAGAKDPVHFSHPHGGSY